MSDTPETNELRDLLENYEHRANMGDVWELCEGLERQRNEWMDRTTDALAQVGNLTEQRDAYAETLRALRVECYDFIDQRHPELAEGK